MTFARLSLAGLALALVTGSALAQPRPVGATDVRHQIIKESIQAHGGYCVCPWQKDRKGHECGVRSLYARGGGYPPQCYEDDVDDAMLEAWLNEHGQQLGR